ncbi:MAG TPA: hypothetical protein VIG49_08700 [Acetobacteraceae bacterium]
MENLALLDQAESAPARDNPAAGEAVSRSLVVVVSDNPALANAIESVCDFLDIGVELLPSEINLAAFLPSLRPMAVIAEMDAGGQDGCHVLMEVAAIDRDLPVMLLTGADSALAGAAEAVSQLWDLHAVTLCAALPRIGQFVDFLFRAGRRTSRTRAVSV